MWGKNFREVAHGGASKKLCDDLDGLDPFVVIGVGKRLHRGVNHVLGLDGGRGRRREETMTASFFVCDEVFHAPNRCKAGETSSHIASRK